MILRAELRRRLGGQHVGRPARVVDHDVEAAVPVDDRVDQRLDRLVVADVAGVELVGQTLDGTPRAGHDGGALAGEDGADSGADPSYTAGHQDDPAGRVRRLMLASAVSRIGHCASVPSKCLLR